MSLLNRMLQDLDARQSGGSVALSLPNDVRPLPAMRGSRWPKMLMGGLAAFATVVATFVFWPSSPPDKVPPRVLGAKSDAPVSAVAALAALDSLEGASLRLSDTLMAAVDEKRSSRASVPLKQLPPVPVSPAVTVRNKTSETNPPRAAPESPFRKVESAKNAEAPQIRNSEGIDKVDVAGSPRDSVDHEYRKAIAVLSQGRSGEAIDGLFAALRIDARHIASRQLLGKLLLESRRNDEAMQLLREGLQLLPGQSGWAMTLARLQVERGDLAGAAQTLERSSPAGSNAPDYQGFFGHVMYRLGKHRESADHYRAAVRLAPGDGRWWLGLGLSYDAEGRVTEAREALSRAKASGTLSADLLIVVEQKLR